jgi:hypothetical protein
LSNEWSELTLGENLKEKLTVIEDLYFCNDMPVPFKDDLKIHPVKVKDYNIFYSLISCFTINKNEDMTGIGISMTHLDYLCHLISEEEKKGQKFLINQFFNLLELIFNIRNGLICPTCFSKDKEIHLFDDINKEIFEISKQFNRQVKEEQESYVAEVKRYLEKIQICPHCGNHKRDLIYIDFAPKHKIVKVGLSTIDSNDYEMLKTVFCYQNILDYDDEYIDPELKEALDETTKLKNKNMGHPSLEKQKACVVISSPYTFDTVNELTLRKFTYLLRTIDSKMQYTAYRQGEMSGLVTFKNELEHWIWSSDKKKDKFSDIKSVDSIKKKFEAVT